MTTLDVPLVVPGAAPSSTHLEVLAPFDGSVIARVRTADAATCERALATAHDLHERRDGRLPVHERVEVLERTAVAMRGQREALATEAAREGGKPLVDSLVEVDRAIDGVRLGIEHLRTQHGREIPMRLNPASANRVAFTSHEPIGVVVAFSAFNHPLNLIVHQVVPAIAVGCPTIVKPAEATPLSAFRLVDLLHEAGLPPGWCQCLLTTGHDVSAKLVSDERVGFFSFIGSAAIGWMLRSQLAPGARCALEHGGAAPAIVAADADLDEALPLLAKGGFYHAGQVCVSVQRVLAHRTVAEEVARRLADAAGALAVGDPTLPETEVGPLIREDEVTRVHEWVREAVAGGARLLCGGEPIGTRCFAPTVLLDPPADAKVSTQEIFGPVVCVYACDDLEQAIGRANAVPFAFQASIFTKNIDDALQAWSGLDASAVMVNDHTAFRVDWMPFAGLKVSGHGVGGIPDTMREMQIEKMVVVKSAALE
jgi:acyl-CoA reductase-like NAD-dependent aldehyde dehydrogenase